MRKITPPRKYRLANPGEEYAGGGALVWNVRLRLWFPHMGRPVVAKDYRTGVVFALPKIRVRVDLEESP